VSDDLEHRIIGRYALFDVLAAGGMATVHIGRLLGPVGFARTVAIKRLHPQFAADPEFVSMFLDEARMCARIRHPNVVPTLDVVAAKGELFLVMEYVAGESLGSLLRDLSKRGDAIPWRIAISILAGTLHGLHAAHEAKDEQGFPLGLVHRDVSPQNILVGSDGLARVVDFGIAKASGRLHVTREGAVKGKVGYMAPEQMAAEKITRQADVYAASAVLWESLTGRRLFDGETEAVILARVLTAEIVPPSQLRPDVPAELDAVVMRALIRDVDQRFATAREMALALEKLGPAALGEVGEWLEANAGQAIEDRARRISRVEVSVASAEAPSNEAPPPPAAKPDVEPHASESIRPTARSDASGSEPLAGKPAADPNPWKPVAAALAVVALGVGAWAALAGRSAEPAATDSPPPSASARTVAMSDATATAAVSTPVSTASAAPAAEMTASASTSVSAQVATVSAVKTGRPPVAKPNKDPFDLGGRK
jgi:eukaryotic-like serine/threonine-protein kinase